VPQISDERIFRLVGQVTTGVPVHPRRPVAGAPMLPRPRTTSVPANQPDSQPGTRAEAAATGGPTARAWHLPDHPEVNALVRARLAAQPDRSVREATRQVNLWEFYERVLSATMPLDDPEQSLARTRRLVILGEIIARWPALQRFLHRRTGERTGLQLLAAAAADDEAWPGVAHTVLGGRGTHDDALHALRQLLCDHDGPGVADLAADLL
jgi:hypothetical protein